jgi:hypothetical protein
MSRFLTAGGLLLVAVLIAGCKQGEGDRCETDSDCSSDLMCEQSNAGGRCTQRTGTPAPPDASRDLPTASSDVPVERAASETATPADAPAADAARGDAAGDVAADARAVDAATTDAPGPDASGG